MSVNYTPPIPEQLLPVPGIMLGTAAAGIKDWSREDVLLITSAHGAQAWGIFTQNRFSAAPVILCREHLARGMTIRALVVNAGNANACTGERGLADARSVCATAAGLVGCAVHEVLPFSTGVIMELLPVDRVNAGLALCNSALQEDGWYRGVRAIMTTDTVPKGASRRIV